MEFNNINVGSGVAQFALDKQLKSSDKYYKEMYSKFVMLATQDDGIRNGAIKNAVDIFGDKPEAYSTLVSIGPLNDEIGLMSKNATIFAIAATCTYLIKGTAMTKGIAENLKNPDGSAPYNPSKSWAEYAAFMGDEHELATLVVHQMRLGIFSKKLKFKYDILQVMGYLIEQGMLESRRRMEKFR